MKLIILTFTLLGSIVAAAAPFDLRCEGDTLLKGIGSKSAEITSISGKGFDWGNPLKLVTSKEEPDCLKSPDYICYSDDKAMINVPKNLASKKVSYGKVYLSTDLGDEGHGSTINCRIAPTK